MEKEKVRNVELIRTLILFIIIVCLVIANLIFISNFNKERKTNTVNQYSDI